MAELKLCIYSVEDAMTLACLWHACFPSDPLEYACDFLQALPGETIVTVGELENRPVTMALLLPATARFRGDTFSVRYLYAGCTHPDARGKGYYRQLMMFAENAVRARGESAIYLHPADDKLEQSYQRMGYLPGISGLSGKVVQSLPQVDYSTYMLYRQNFMEEMTTHTVVFNPASSVISQFLQDAMLLADEENGCAIYNDTMIEWFGKSYNRTSDAFCLWLPTDQSALKEYICRFGGYTGAVGE